MEDIRLIRYYKNVSRGQAIAVDQFQQNVRTFVWENQSMTRAFH